ncbi:MAG: glycosyltransferase family 2 protein [Armatimonadota bacterium]
MRLSIIIVNWNTKDLLRRCLQSIYENPATGDMEIIVVDNASGDESASMVRNEFGDVLLIANSENTGYAEGNNQGFKIAKSDNILLLNPDTEIRPCALDVMLSFLGAHPDAAAVAPKLVYPDGRPQSSCRGFPEPWSILFEYTKLSRIFPGSRTFGAYRMTWFDYSRESEVDQPMASCMLIPRKAVDDIGIFDAGFPIFFNEVDWCYRAKQRGWKIFYTPNAEVLHHVGGSTRQVKPAMIKESHRSLKKFYDKHYKNRISSVLYWIIMSAISVNSFLISRLKPIVTHR